MVPDYHAPLLLGMDGNEVLYGTQNGKMGLVRLGTHEPTYRWDMLNERHYGGITSIATGDLTGGADLDVIYVYIYMCV